MKKIFITGGAGYVGSMLVPYLLNKGHKVYDTLYYGHEFLPKSKFKYCQRRHRDSAKLKEECKNYDIFIHLACISNDASYVLDENLSKSINYDAFDPMVKLRKLMAYKIYLCIHKFCLWSFR